MQCMWYFEQTTTTNTITAEQLRRNYSSSITTTTTTTTILKLVTTGCAKAHACERQSEDFINYRLELFLHAVSRSDSDDIRLQQNEVDGLVQDP